MPLPLTPYVQIDEAKALANIHRYQTYCDRHSLKLRPHIKTHKTIALAKAQMAAGAIGITCQKITEAEVFAKAGFKEMMLTYNLLGQDRIARLGRLHRSVHLSVVADHPHVVAGLAQLEVGDTRPLPVLVEVNTGANRCGVATIEDVLLLAKQIASAKPLTFGGLMTYPPVGGTGKADEMLTGFSAELIAAGLGCPVISSGGSPDMWQAHTAKSTTEYRVGTYVYYDRSLVMSGACHQQDCALAVKSMVVSVQGTRFILDAGSKALTSDLMGCVGHGYIVEFPRAEIYGLSEEHGHVDARDCAQMPQVGDIVTIIPNHACPVSNLFDQVHIVGSDGSLTVRKVDARGCVG